MIVFTLLSDFIHTLNDHGLGFLFSDQIKYHDPPAIHRNLQESIKCFRQAEGIESIFHKLVSTDNVDIGLKIENIDKFLKKSGLTEDQKQFVFLWLNAFQKVYRKIQEIITSTKDEKVQAAHIWFGKNLSQLKRDGDIPKAIL